MPICQHGNEAVACREICGISFCRHTCAEHEMCELDPDEGTDDEACWTRRRNCLLTDCDCGVFMNQATQAQAEECARSATNSLVQLFSEAKNRGENFQWGKMESFVIDYALNQWKLSARYGFEQEVKDTAIIVWRDAEMTLFWNEPDEEEKSDREEEEKAS